MFVNEIKYPCDFSKDYLKMVQNQDLLIKDIKENGLLVPILISTKGWIISGRRRFLACRISGMCISEIPVTLE